MDINHKILEEIGPYLHYYDCQLHELTDFVEHTGSFDDRQKKAIRIIEGIITRHGKAGLLRYVAELAKVEVGIRELKPQARDHVVHALLCFILGIYINEKFCKPIMDVHIDYFQWKIAGLFHDVGYPIQVAKDIMVPFAKKMNEIQDELGIGASEVIFEIVPKNLELLTNRPNSLTLIQSQLNQWWLDIKADKTYRNMMKSGDVCHGMISGLSVLRIIDLLYQKHNPKRESKDTYCPDNINWNQAYFKNDIIPACSAIFIHNLSGSHFLGKKIDFSKAPIAFLLKLSDSLQDWERPSRDNPVGLPSSKFDIDIEDQNLIFKTGDKNSKAKIQKEIISYLVSESIHIRSL